MYTNFGDNLETHPAQVSRNIFSVCGSYSPIDRAYIGQFHTDISPILSTVLANTLIYIGAILLLFGVAEFMGLKVRLLPYIISTGIFISLYSFYTLYNPNTQVRLMVFTLMTIPVFAHTIYLIVVKAEPVYSRCAEHVVIAHIFFDSHSWDKSVHCIKSLSSYRI